MNSELKKVNRNQFSRDRFIQKIEEVPQSWDIIVIGGGATGLGCALDAASRGYRTLLLEQADFAKGTSSRSTKLVHGGVRYLAQGNISLVYEALFERGLLLQNAAHLVSIQPFIIPGYQWWDKFFYGIGLKLYDWMARSLSFHKTSLLSRQAVEKLLPNVQRKGLKGGVMYYDGQFDDSRLAVNLAQTCAEQGGVLLNYMKVEGLIKEDKGKVRGVRVKDLESGQKYELTSKVVINATGIFVDEVMRMDVPAQVPLVTFSQGVHLVLDKSFFKGDAALMIPKTADGRVLFVLPWHDHVLVGTTDTPLENNSLEPVALQNEIKFILKTAGEYLIKKPTLEDVLSVFAGLRPLAIPDKKKGNTKEISRGHKIISSPSGLLTITGGKWTTYRKMAEEAMDKATKIAGLEKKACTTAGLKIHGYESQNHNGIPDHLHVYGRDAQFIRDLQELHPELKEKLHENFAHTLAEVVWAVRNEMARTVEDVLARRLRVLFLDARAAIDMVPKVAGVMAKELGKDEAWQEKQVKEFSSLAANYLPVHYLSKNKEKKVTTIKNN